MADQNITELPVKTSSGMTSSDYMLGIDSAEGYQMLIKDLGDYIIRNVQVNTIAGANQTLKSALDTLNSNIDTKDAAPKTVDLNSLGNGIHTHSSTSTNIPVSGMGGTVLSLRNNYNSQGAQLAQANTEDGLYYRNLINSNWGNWAKLPTRNEVDTLKNKTSVAGSITYNGLTFSMFANSLTASLKIRGKATDAISLTDWTSIGSVGNFGLREDFYTKAIANNRTSIISIRVLSSGSIYISGAIPQNVYVELDVPIML